MKTDGDDAARTIIGVVGAGAMGAGIAQVAAQAGFSTRLFDVEQAFLDRGTGAIRSSLERFVARSTLSAEERDRVLARVRPTLALSDLGDCAAVIEAVPERMDLKRDVFQRLDQACPTARLLATNTSSLSVTEIAAATAHPGRVVGLHFFNPPVLMSLVEVVRGETSSDDALETAHALVAALGKTPVSARDTPGFIVNRVARPFYLEPLRMLGEGLASVEDIDAAVRGLGFRMGPFQLMDLVGIDVNFAVSQSVYEQTFGEPRYRPHPIQQAMVRAGRLGRKTGRGFYDHASDPPTPVEAALADPPSADTLAVFWDRWEQPTRTRSAIAGRMASVLVNEAYFALGEGVASASDIDLGMRLGTNWPKGPLSWGDEIGLPLVRDTLDYLWDFYHEERFRVAPHLRRSIGTGGTPLA